MQKHKGVLSTLALSLVLLGSACSGTFRQPEVELQSVELGGLGLSGGTLLVNVQVHNPNSFTLTADQVRYELLVKDSQTPGDTAWTQFANGTYDRQVSVRGGRTETFQVPVEFNYSTLRGAASSVLRTGRFDYRARGSVMAKTPFGSREVPFRKAGTMLLNGTSIGR